jgi:hypothetical protein
MSFTSYSFKDNIVINNSKWIRWLNSTGTTRENILGLQSNNVYLNSGGEDLYINNNSNSYTFINSSNTKNAIIGSKLAIGIETTSNLNSVLSLANEGYIGTNVKNGYIGLSGTYSSSHTDGSLIKLYGNDSSNYGQIHIITGNHTSGHLNFYTGNNSLKMQILNSGIINFSPDGSTVKLSVSNSLINISSPLKITDTTETTDSSTGALIVDGGISISKNLYVGGNIISQGVSYGDTSFGNLIAESLSLGVSKTISGTFNASNNVSSPSNITGLLFDSNNIRSFQGSISITIVRSSGGNLYENISIEGNYTETNGWSLFTSSIGDITGVTLSITSIGQLRYTSTNQANWTSTTLRYVLTYISNTNNYEGMNITSGTFLVSKIQINDSANAVLNSENGSLYSLGGGTFEKDLIIKGNLITTNITTATINASTGITCGNLQSTNINTTNITTATINASTGITCGNLQVSNINVTIITSGAFLISAGGFNATYNSNTLGSLITTGGNIGIGKNNPSYKLDVVGDINFTGNLYQNDIIFSGGGGGSSYWTLFGNDVAYTKGNVGIGTTSPGYKLHVDGKIYSSDMITAFSDIALKENINNLNNSLDKIKECRGVSFTRKDTQEKHIGFIAQEIETIFPELICMNTLTGYKSIAYGNMVAILLEAIKELSEKVDLLSNKLNASEEKNNL